MAGKEEGGTLDVTVHDDNNTDTASPERGAYWARLLSLSADTNQNVVVDTSPYVIGRAAVCNTVIAGNRLISSQHCNITQGSDGRSAYIADTSTNGTLLNGTRLKKRVLTELKQGDEVTLVRNKKDPSKNVQFVFHFAKPAGDADMCTGEEEGASVPMDGGEAGLGVTPSLADPKGGFFASDEEDDEMDDPLPPPPTATKPAVTAGVKRKAEGEAEGSGAAPPPPAAAAAAPYEEDELEENLMCSICREVFHDCVSLVPCLHSFCAGCYSEWMARSKECPDCRTKVDQVRHNTTIRNLVTAYLKKFPDKRRPEEDIKELDEKNKITSAMLYSPRKKRRRDDSDEDYSAEEDSDDDSVVLPAVTCRACLGPVGGFQCSAAPAAQHVACRCCFQPMPRRNVPATAPLGTGFGFGTAIAAMATGLASAVGIAAPAAAGAPAPAAAAGAPATAGGAIPQQYCTFCRGLYCNLYWKCTSAACGGTCLLALKDFKFSEAELGNCVNGNKVESDFLKKYMRQEGISAADMYAECIAKLDSKEFTCTGFVEPPTGDKPSCKICAKKIIAQLGYQYRKAIPKRKFLTEATRRRDCWYGKACRTQFNPTNMAHAQRLNHICDQTKY